MSELATSVGRLPVVRPDDPAYGDVVLFLHAEAERVDRGDLAAWTAMLGEVVRYTAPVRTTHWREHGGPAGRTMLFDEDRASIDLRVRRLLESDSVWAENPVPRTRRFVSNIRVHRGDDDVLWALSYLLVARSRGDSEVYQMLTAERVDRLTRSSSGDLQLVEREIVLDQTRLGVPNLPFPL